MDAVGVFAGLPLPGAVCKPLRASGRIIDISMETLPPAESAVVQRIASDLKGRPGPLLEVLHAVQAALGYVPGAAVPIVAEVLNLSRAEVHGVVTFYHYFRRSRPAAHPVSLCQAEACQSMGAA